jgi:C1A family cysteine protease
MGSMKLRALALKAEADYAKAKYDTMILSEKTTKRVKNILKALDCGLSYDNGYVVGVTKRGAMYKSDAYLAMDRGEIEEYAKEFELNKAVDDLLRK